MNEAVEVEMKPSMIIRVSLIAGVLLQLGTSHAQCLGKQTQVLPVGPTQIITADFNHDGFPDLATAIINQGYRGRVTVFLGDGKGTFVRPGHAYYENLSVLDLAAGDFNNDGELDVIDVSDSIYDFEPKGIGIFLGNGDGTFSQHIHHEDRNNLHHVAVGDFNADGNLDAVVSSHDFGYLAIYLGQGDGTLIGPVPVPTVAVKVPWEIMTGDYNQDGISDIVVLPASVPDNLVEVRIGNGDGTFHLGGVYQTHTRDSTTMAQGDFNEDGVIDLAVADFQYPAGVEILIGNGDGTFQSGVKYQARSTFHLGVGDFNGDGHLDLLSLQDTGLYGRRKLWTLQVGNGDGTFQRPVDHYNLMIDTQAMAVADLNQDGFADLALTDSTDVAVFPNLGNCP